ncbi:MAG: hypothetical protein H6711_21640 [Myxococcales bacterium]|nr:hypothetical protein [Myxococcales bacterium]
MPRWRTRRPRFAAIPRLLGAASLLLSIACATTPERLPPLTRQFYYNLPTPEDQQAFLKLKESERQSFLEDKGLWAKWTALPAEERQAVQGGELRPGFHEFGAFMAWGPPADTQNRGDARAHTYIRCTSGPKAGRYVASNLECDGTSSEIEVSVVSGSITEIKYLN